MKVIEVWLLNASIAFIVRQVGKFSAETDWEKVKADLGQRVMDLLPGDWFDHEGVNLVNEIVDACSRALATTKSLEILLKLLAEKKYPEATEKLRSYLLKSWKPESAIANSARSQLEAYSFV